MNETQITLPSVASGKPLTSGELLPLVYGDLRRLATIRMAREGNNNQTLQPTALVHEAWLRIAKAGRNGWDSQAHFFGAAARAMRCILIEKARSKVRLRHGGDWQRADIDEINLAETTPDEKALLIDDALGLLEAEHPERARVVVLKFFGGLTNREVAEVMGIGERTVDRHWVCAKSRLFHLIRSQS